MNDSTTPLRSKLGCLILAGGQSRRMGVDKWQLTWCGQTFLEHLIDIGQTTTRHTLVSIGYDQPIEWLDRLDLSASDLTLIRDATAGLGPLEGIRGGLRFLADREIELAFVIACDYPEIDTAWVCQLAANIESHQAIIPREGGRYCGLNAVYRTSLSPSIEAMLSAGQRRVQDWIARLDVRTVERSELQSWGLNLDALNNINTPQAYDNLRNRRKLD